MQELLNGGLVNARDPSMLAPGELVLANNLIYMPASPSPQQALGHLDVATWGGTTNGLVHCAFDNGLSLLVAQVLGSYKRTDAVNPGIVSTLGSPGAGTALDSVHYENRHYLFNGLGPNQVLRQDGTLRRHGLIAVSGTIGVEVSSTAPASWPLINDTLPAFYEYWTTEVYINDALGEEVESTFTGSPVTAFISASNQKAIISQPQPINPSATHWRIYRSEKKGAQADTAFPRGWLIGELPISVRSFEDGGGTSPGLTLPTTAVNATLAPRFGGENGFTIVSNPWDPAFPPANVLLDDGTVAKTGNLPYIFPGNSVAQYTVMKVGDFGFTNIGTPITSITVEVKGKKVNNGALLISLSANNGVTRTDQAMTVPLTTASSTKSVVGLWNRTWNGNEFVDGVFSVYAHAYGADTGGSNSIEIDYIKVNILHGGTTGAQVVPFPTTTVTIGDTSYSDGSRGEPPVAGFGDIYEDSLVVNDPDIPNAIRYSLETLPDSFPPEYFLPFSTSLHDRVTAIKTLGNVLIVGLSGYLARVDYLPRAEDAEFARGRSWDIVQGSHGVVGKKALVQFFIPKIGLWMAHVSTPGHLMMTNGYHADTLTDDVDFTRLADPNKLYKCEFKNEPEFFRLILYYTPSGGSSNTKALVFHYHPLHLKDGKPKVTGPLDVASDGAVLAILPDGQQRFYTTSGGHLFQENNGIGAPFVLKTRDIYPGGYGNASVVTKMMIHQSGGGTYTITPTVMSTNTNPRTEASISATAPSRGFVRVPMQIGCEGVSFTITASSTGLDYLTLEGTGFQGEAYPNA